MDLTQLPHYGPKDLGDEVVGCHEATWDQFQMVIFSEVYNIHKLEVGPVGIEDGDSVDQFIIVNSIIDDHPIFGHCPAGKVRSVSPKGSTSSVKLV